jgi:murein L,D-transpeptidase YcbB/YkuD
MRIVMPIMRLISVALSLLLVVVTASADDASLREAIRGEIEHLRESDRISVGNVPVASGDLLAEVYERRGFAPAWPDAGDLESLIDLVRATRLDGLDPDDYHLADLERTRSDLASGVVLDDEAQAALDIGMTDSLIRLGYHQRFGKVNPYDLDPIWNFNRTLNGRDPAAVVLEAIDAPSLSAFRDAVFPRTWVYRQLQGVLEDHYRIAAAGGWPSVPEGPTLRPGATDPRLAAFADRLRVSGDLPKNAMVDETIYGGELEKAIRMFQERHGLEADGLVGPATLRAMNVPVEARIDQLRVNLERGRWVLDDLEDDFILVNIAGFRVYVFRDRKIDWSSRVVVGRTYRKTPVFRDMMKYVVFNPTWTVPYSIATKDILPQVQRDVRYLANGNYIVKDRSGDAVDPGTIDWSSLSQRNFPYTLVQQPGVDNALGEIKFMFPNEYAIYLHDTPGKGLFEQASRTFSSGCVRVERPFDFAHELMGPDGWDPERIEAERQTRETRTIFLGTPIPVLLLYWTAEVGEDGKVRYYEDVYERDQAVLDALEEDFRLDIPSP